MEPATASQLLGPHERLGPRDQECGKLLDAASKRWRPLIATAVFTGLRISELLALRWQDVNFSDGLIHLRWQLSIAKADIPARPVPLKTDAGARDLYMLPELAAALRRHKLASGHSQDGDYCFATNQGKPVSQRNALRALAKVAEDASLNPEGVDSLSWHDLRHTAVSRLIAAGLDVVEVQRQAGHSRPSVTLDIYWHEFEKAKRSEDIRAKIAATGLGTLLAAPK
jgi:integrase